MAEERQRKIAVIGTSGYDYSTPEVRVDCFTWDRISKVKNLADYDEVVIDLLSVENSEALDGDSIEGVLNVRSAYEVLSRPEGSIYVLGDPRYTVSVEAFMHRPVRAGQPFLSWTGMNFVWDDRPGDTVEREPEAEKEPIKTFVDSLTGWDYSLDRCEVAAGQFDGMFDLDVLAKQGLKLAAASRIFCTTRYGNPLIFSVRLSATDVKPPALGVPEIHRETLSGPIAFLPKLDTPEQEMVELVLRELCDVDVSAPEPAWVSGFVAPGQEEMERGIYELESRIDDLVDQRDRKIDELSELREPLKLLYESGIALEEAVWAVMEALGAEVERPEDRTKEDGWITVRTQEETLEGVLEIKGVGGKHFNLGGLRQLTDWIERGMTHHSRRYFGIFVGNSSIKDPPRSRIWPFNKNWVEQAQMRGYGAIRTEDLYLLYLLDRTGRLDDREDFWKTLFKAQGPLDVRPYWERLTEDEAQQLKEPLPE